MEADFRLIIDFVSVLVAAALGGLLAARFRQPVLLGYILGGMIVGPAGLQLIKELIQIQTLAQFGVAFLLFALGVEFSFAEIKKVKGIAIGGGSAQIILTIIITTLFVIGIGWLKSPVEGIFLGAILSLSSTAVVLKSLMERNETETPHAQVMLGILVVQDLALGLMLAVLPALDQPLEKMAISIAIAVGNLLLIGAGAVIAGIWIVPPLLRILAQTESREIFLLGVVTLCLCIALLTEYLGLSIEMGAFVSGLMISEVEYADQTLNYVESLRDIFSAIFFASIGMLIDPVYLWNHLSLILGLVFLVIVGKSLITTPLVRAFGYSWKTAITAGLGLAQIGEFSFVLASQGQALGLVSRQAYLLILGTTAVTLVLTPFVLQLIPKLFELLESISFLQKFLNTDQPIEVFGEIPLKDHIVICGYGRVGRNLVKLIDRAKYPIVVIDQSESRIQLLRETGIPYVYGNVASLHVLQKGGVDRASGMLIALPESMSARLCLKRALELNPDLDVVVRAKENKDIELLYQLGAQEVVQPEFEASLEMATHVLISRGLPKQVVMQQIQKIRKSHYLDLRQEDEEMLEPRIVTLELNGVIYEVPLDSPLVGMTIEQADLRRLTGVSIIEIKRANGEIAYLDNQTVIESSDRLLVVGNKEEQAAFKDLMRGEATVPDQNIACQWLMIPDNSPVIAQTLGDLNIRKVYEVQIQAIRREGKFIHFPDGSIDLRIGDRLLIVGSSRQLQKLRMVIIPPPVTIFPSGITSISTPIVDIKEAS